MNPYTGELRELRSGEELPDSFDRVPASLRLAASLKLAAAAARGAADKFGDFGGAAAKVNLRSSHPLADWAREQRKKKHKAKIAAASRRRNRK
jgi:hypothetical protein